MADKTIHQLGAIGSIASNDEVSVWDLSAGQFVRCPISTLIGATILNGGTLDLANHTLTVPATGTAALLETTNVFTVAQTIPRIRSATATSLADDTALSFTPLTSNGILIILGNNLATCSGIIMYRCGGGSQCALLGSSAGTLLNCVIDTALAGTTGTDAKVNISADGTSGKIYIENRRGGTTAFSWLEIG